MFAQLTNLVGPGNVVRAAQAMGITTPLQPYFSIGLGAEPATPLEMARAYATLADGGYRLDSSIFGDQPLAVKSVTFPAKKPTIDYTEPKAIPWLTNGNAAIEDQMLQGVVQYGTGVSAALPGVEVAGKTGTTENFGDAWFVGFTPDVVTAVWVGYPNKLVPMLTEFHGQPVEGGTYPALIWKAFMEKALPYMAGRSPTAPTRRRRCRPPSIPYATPATVIFRNNRARARQRQLQRRRHDAVLLGHGADRGRALQAERGRGARRARRDARCREDKADRPAAARDDQLHAGSAGKDGRCRRLPDAARRHALGLRQGEARASRGRSTASCRGSSGCRSPAPAPPSRRCSSR